MMKTFFLCSVIFFVCSYGGGGKPEVKRLEPEEFAILPWGGSPGDLDALKDIRDCGFNIAGFMKPEHVLLAKQAGLKSIVSDSRITNNLHNSALSDDDVLKYIKSVMEPFKAENAVYGYYLQDEPNAGAFPALARWAGAIRQIDSKPLVYINLFPNYASSEQLGTKTYDEHLEVFVNTVKPTFLSYDHYALMDDGSLRYGYFQNLEAVRNASLKHGIPFWNIVLGNAHFHYAEPTAGGLRFQVYTTLAYGGRGISYFTYFAPLVGNYRNAPVDQFMNKTPTWDLMRNVNLQIHRLGPTYLKLKSVNVFHHPDVPEGCQGMASSKFVKSIDGGNFLVGEFEGPEGRPYVMVVNKDLHKSASFAIQFKEQGAILFTNPYTGETGGWGGENGWLASGQGMLLSLQK